MERYNGHIIKFLTNHSFFFWMGITLLLLIVLALIVVTIIRRRNIILSNKIEDFGADKTEVVDIEKEDEKDKQRKQYEKENNLKFQKQETQETEKENDISDEAETEFTEVTGDENESDPKEKEDIHEETEKDSSPVITESHRKECENLLDKNIDNQLNNISEIFRENKLIGNHDLSEDEYSELLEHASLLCCSFMETRGCNAFETKYHQLIFITLVELAKDGEIL